MKQKGSLTQYVAMAVLLVCAAARPLEDVWIRFKWIDEVLCVGAFMVGVCLWLRKRELRRQIPRHLLYFIPFVVYMVMQLVGSLVFRLQPWSAMIIDGITNAKFWIALYGCYLIGRLVPEEEVDKGLLNGAKAVTVVLSVLFILERCRLGFTGGRDTLLGIPYSTIIYGEPTYLAAATVMLLAVLLSQWENKLLPFALADLLMLFFTFRSKGYGAMVMFAGLLGFVVLWKQRVRIWHVGLGGGALLAVGWKKIAYYFLDNHATAPRAIMMKTSLQILREYFPLGTGFGTFGSHQAVVHYSPLYTKYGFENDYYLNSGHRKFMDDTFWPIVFAQSGAIGLGAFVAMLFLLIGKAWGLFSYHRRKYAASLFAIAYCLIDTLAEASFNHVATIPLALLMGMWFGAADRQRAANQSEKKGV